MPTPFRLMLVTDRTFVPPGRLPDLVDCAIRGGVDAVQLREKDLSRPELIALGHALREVTHGRALLLVNGSAELARAVGADGVHLPESAQPLDELQRRGLLLGRSVHSLETAQRAEAEGCNYVVLGTIFATRSHPGGHTGGIERIRAVSSVLQPPVIAIGGIDQTNAEAVVRAGASGVAVISALLTAPDPSAAAGELRDAIGRGLRTAAGAPR